MHAADTPICRMVRDAGVFHSVIDFAVPASLVTIHVPVNLVPKFMSASVFNSLHFAVGGKKRVNIYSEEGLNG